MSDARIVQILEQSNIRLYQPGAALGGSPLTVTAVASKTTNGSTTGLLYIYSTVDFHLKVSTASPATSATTNDAPFPGLTPLLFAVPAGSRVSFVKRTGVSDGTVWVHHNQDPR